MSDLAYTVKSFSKLTAKTVRSGNDISLKDPEVRRISSELRESGNSHRAKLKEIAKSQPDSKDAIEAEKSRYTKECDEYIAARANAVTKSIEKSLIQLDRDIEKSKFSWGLKPGPEINKRKTYSISDDFYRAVVSKQVERTIRQAAGYHQQSRMGIIASLKDALNKTFEFEVWRLDIEKFFDSVPHDNLTRRIEGNSRIDSVTRHLISVLLSEYRSLTGHTVGIPQGVGVSSPLAELYLFDLDKYLFTHPDVSFFARFVDDFVIVTKADGVVGTLKYQVVNRLEELGLEVNWKKSAEIKADAYGAFLGENTDFDFLGFNFSKSGKQPVKVRLSKSRVERIRCRLERAFTAWKKHRMRSDPGQLASADSLLAARIEFLTSNTKLQRAKDGVTVGIYHSNREITDHCQLEYLDKILEETIIKNKKDIDSRLLRKLKSYSFRSGFHDRKFVYFDMHQLQKISNCWRDLQ